MGSLICVTAIFLMRSVNDNFFFQWEGKKIYLVGSVNVRAHM